MNPQAEGVLVAVGLLALLFAIIAWMIGLTRMTAERRAAKKAARVFEGTVKPPNGYLRTVLDDGVQARDFSDMVTGLDGKRVRVTVEVLENGA